jgi:hypothetical protein
LSRKSRPTSGRRLSQQERILLFWRAGGICESCGTELDASFHADHVHPWSKGGETKLWNMAALCAPCNLRKGNTMLRKHQKRMGDMDMTNYEKLLLAGDLIAEVRLNTGPFTVNDELPEDLLGELFSLEQEILALGDHFKVVPFLAVVGPDGKPPLRGVPGRNIPPY